MSTVHSHIRRRFLGLSDDELFPLLVTAIKQTRDEEAIQELKRR